MERPNADEIMRSIKGIPLLIQAIQYSLEAAYVPTRDSTTAGPTVTDSAIESSITTHEYYPNIPATSTDPSQISINGHTDTVADPKRSSVQRHGPNGSDRRIQQPPRRRTADLKRQSIFVVFPYSETVPIDQAKLRMRRSSSDHDLDYILHGRRKSSFERFCAAAIAGQTRCASTMLIESELNSTRAEERNRSYPCEQAGSDDEHGAPSSKVHSLKRSEVRRPSLEVRYVGLQSILLAKMSAKQKQDSS